MGPGDSPDQEHTGCMIALRLPIDQAARVSHPTGVPASDYHVTLAYLGKVEDISDDDRQEIAEAVAETAQEFPPLKGHFPSGFGTFTPGKSSDGKTPYWAQPDVPDIHEFRHRLMERLDEHGVAGYVATDHGFNPHVTIGYLDPDEEPPAPPPVSPAPISFRDVHLVFGPDNTRIPLLGQSGDDAAINHPTVTSAAAPPVAPPRPVRRRVSPIPAGVERVLQRMVKEHNSRVPTDLRVRTPTVRAVYARGVQGFNLAEHPGMTRDGHAFKRVSDFLSSISEHQADDSRYVSELQDMDLLPRPVVLALRRPSLREATTPLAQAGATDLVAALVSAAVFPATDPRRRLTLSRITAAARAGGLATAHAIPALQALLADGNSRAARSARARRQLRDRFGKWIEMGGGLRFKVKSPGAPGGGKWYHGNAVGLDPANGLVQVKLNQQDGGQTVSVPANKVEKTKATLPGPGGQKAELPDDPNAPQINTPELKPIAAKDVTPGDAPTEADDSDLPPQVRQSIDNLNQRIPDDHPLANQRDAFADRMRVAFHDRNDNTTDADEYRADAQELIDDLDTFTDSDANLDDNSREAFQDFAGDVATFRDDPLIVHSGDGKESTTKATLPEKPTTPSGQSLMGDAPNDPTSEGRINTSGVTEQRAGEAVASVVDSLRQAAKDAGKDPATGTELYNWIKSNTNPNTLQYNGDLITKNGADKIPVPNRPPQQDIYDAAKYLNAFGHNNAVHGAGEGSGLKRANAQKTAAKELARLQNSPEFNPTHPSNKPTPTPTPEAPPAPPAPSTPAPYDDTADIAGNLEDLAAAWDEAVNQLPPELRADARTMRNVIYNASDQLQSGGVTREQARDALRESLTEFEDIAYDMTHDDADTDHLISDLTGGVWDALDALDGPNQGAPGDENADANVVTDQFGNPVPSHWNNGGQDADENGNPIEHWVTGDSNDTIDVGASDGETTDETGEKIPNGEPVYVLRDESGAAIGNYVSFDDASDAHDFSHDVANEPKATLPEAPAQPEPSSVAVDQERIDNNLDNADRPLPTGWTADRLNEGGEVIARGPDGHVAFTGEDGHIEVAKLNPTTGKYEPAGEFDNWGDAREAVTPAVPAEAPTPEAVLPEPIQTTLGKPPFNILSEEERGKSGDGYHPSGPYGRYGAAGLMIRAKDPNTGEDQFLIVQRGQGLSSNKGRWQFPGGALDEHETPQQGAARELSEEVNGGAGILNDLAEVDSNVYTNGTDWAYTTTMADIPNTFEAAPFPGNEWETGAAKWVSADELRQMSQDGKMIPALSNGAVDPLIAKFGVAQATTNVDEANLPNQPVETPAPTLADEVYDTTDWVKVGGQGGSNAGGTYRAPDGSLYYVKQPKSPNHAHNEVLASSLYSELGVPAAYVRLGDGGVIVSKIVPGAKSDLQSHLNEPEYLKKLQDGFVVDAWLANWDVAGLVYDNVVSDENGDPVRVDGGGALVFRAMGTPKGHLFGDTVGEIETLRDPYMNPTSTKVFGAMTEQDMRESAKKLLDISESRIDELVDSTGFDAQNKELLKQKLKSRRNDLLKRFDLVNSYNASPSMVDDAVKDLDHTLNAPELQESIPGTPDVVSMPEAGEPIDNVDQLEAMVPGTNIAAGEQLLKKQPDGTWINSMGWDYSPDWIMQQGETALLGDIPSAQETPLEPWEQELMDAFTPPAPDAIPDTGPKVRIAADGVTQLEIGMKVTSLKDGKTGTVVKHDPSDKYVKVKMDDSGKTLARATKTLMPVDQGGGQGQDTTPDAPAAPAPDAAPDVTPESGTDSAPDVPTAFTPQFVQDINVALGKLYGDAADEADPEIMNLLDDVTSELKVAKDDYPKGLATASEAIDAVHGAKNALNTLATMPKVEDTEGMIDNAAELFDLAAELEGAINEDISVNLPDAAPGAPLPFTVGGRNVKMGDTVYSKDANGTWKPATVIGVKEFPDPWGGTTQSTLELQTSENSYVYAQDDIGLINQSTMNHLSASPPNGTVLPLSYSGGDQKMVVGDEITVGGIDGFTIAGIMHDVNASNLQYVKVKKTTPPNDSTIPVIASQVKLAPATPESAMPGPTPITEPDVTPAVQQLNLGAAYALPPEGAAVSHIMHAAQGDRYLVTHPDGSIQVYSKNGVVEKGFSQKLSSYDNSVYWKPYTPTAQQLTTPESTPASAVPQIGESITDDTDLNALPVGAKVNIDTDTFTKTAPNAWVSPGGASWSDVQVKESAKYDGGSIVDNGSGPAAPAAPSSSTLKVGDPITADTDVSQLPVGARVGVDDAIWTKIAPDQWESPSSPDFWSDGVLLNEASMNDGELVDTGAGVPGSTGPKVNDPVGDVNAVSALPVGTQAFVGDTVYEKINPDLWKSMSNNLSMGNDQLAAKAANSGGGVITKLGQDTPAAPAAPTLAQNPPSYAATVMGQDGNHLWVGATVVHPVHGKGTVASIESNGNYLKVWGADGKKRALSRKKLKLDGVPPHSTTKGGNNGQTQSAVPAAPNVSAPYTSTPISPTGSPSAQVFPEATNASGQLVAGEPDPSSPLFQAPEPQPPAQPALAAGKVVGDEWLAQADANYRKRMKANNPSWTEKPLSESTTYNEYIAVQEGSESSLKTLLNKTRITQEMYDDALNQIQTKSVAKNEAIKAWEAQYKEYSAKRAEWLSANGQRGIILKGMSEGALHLNNEEAYNHFWDNYKPGIDSPGDGTSKPGQFSPKAIAGIVAQKGSSYWQSSIRALKKGTLKLSNLNTNTRNLDRAMAETTPLKEDIMMIRTLGSDSFINPKTGLPYASHQAGSLNDIVGSVQHDWGFAEASPGSLTKGSSPGYHAGNVTMQFRVPKGTKGVYTAGPGYSHPEYSSSKPYGPNPYASAGSHKQERGFILERGLAYYIHKVEKKNGQWHVDAEIIPKDVGYGDFGHFTGPDFDPSAVFYPPGTAPIGATPVVPGAPAAPAVPGETPATPGASGAPAAVSV